MADRAVHYEAAFEGYLRDRGIPYVAVDEGRRALFASISLKSFDFVVYGRRGPNLLVDIKGRRMRGDGRGAFQTWATEKDVDDLLQWERVFGDSFRAVLMFVYWIDAPLLPEPGMFPFGERWYLMLGVALAEYRQHMRRRSERWRTVAIPQGEFRSLARPVESWLSCA